MKHKYIRMETLAVFRRGKWISYTPRAPMMEPRIPEKLHKVAAAVYGTAISKGMDENTAHILAEATVFKRIYKELEYDMELEEKLKQIRS